MSNLANYLFPLRKDLSVALNSIPRDLTKGEVERIVMFLEMLVVPSYEKKDAQPEIGVDGQERNK